MLKGRTLHLQHIKFYLYGFVDDGNAYIVYILEAAQWPFFFLCYFSEYYMPGSCTQTRTYHLNPVLTILKYISIHFYLHTHILYTSMPMSTLSQDCSVTLYFLLKSREKQCCGPTSLKKCFFVVFFNA